MQLLSYVIILYKRFTIFSILFLLLFIYTIARNEQFSTTVFTKSLALSLADQLIRVNAVAPGPIWTPLIPSSFNEQEVEIFGTETPLKRAGQPFELAPAYLYLASDDSRYVTGQIIHVNGGTIV